jgi:tetratricopeptide (TPR) repeat protein
MRSLPVCMIAMGLLVTGCETQAKNDAAGEDLAKMIQESQQAGFERHDLEAFLTIWTDDARWSEGRTEKADKYDTVLTRGQIEATYKLRFAVQAPKGVKVEFKDLQTETNGDEATVRYRVTISQPRRAETADEVFRLRRKDGKWKVYEHRSWPVEHRGSDYIQTFEAATWKALDEQANRVATLGEKVAALIQGRRYKEAHDTAKEWTKEAGIFSDPWVSRGLTAMAAGDAADAKASFKKALELDPNANMPEYARAAATKKEIGK